MQSEWGRPDAGARAARVYRQCGRLCALALSLAAAACANIGQIGNLTDGPRATVAFESLDGAPPAVAQKFMATLKAEAADRHIAVVAPGQADFRLRGYLSAQPEGGATAIAWAWDVYDANQRRAFRFNGNERAAAGGWAGADDATLHRLARASIDQLAVFTAARPATTAAAEPAPAAVETRSAMFGWIDDWAPETAGIFRIFRREPKPPEVVEAGIALPPPGEVPLPHGRPAPADASGRALAFAAGE